MQSKAQSKVIKYYKDITKVNSVENLTFVFNFMGQSRFDADRSYDPVRSDSQKTCQGAPHLAELDYQGTTKVNFAKDFHF